MHLYPSWIHTFDKAAIEADVYWATFGHFVIGSNKDAGRFRLQPNS